MLKRFLHTVILLTLCAGMFAFIPAAPAAASAVSKGVSPEGMLNPDGSLKLDSNFRGVLDLEGWSVQMDAARGPILSPHAAQDNWAEVGTDGGPFNDGINEVAIMGTDVYVGGWFRDAGGVPEADFIAKWNGSQWVALSNGGSGQPALTSAVYDMRVIGSDLYVAGWFSTSNTSGDAIANASRFAKWNGSVWSAVPGMTGNLNNHAEALGYDAVNNIIYIGGRFTNANGNSVADRVFGIDLDTNSMVTLGSNGASDGSLNNNVYALAVDSTGVVYVGGFFTDVSNGLTTLTEADYIAKWDGANWSALGNNGAGVGALNAYITALAVDASNNVYAGGSFTDAAGIATADYIAKWNGANWSALGSDGAGNGALLSTGSGGVIQEIVINGTDVYAGGYFVGSSAIPTADYVARFDTVGGSWSSLGNNGSGNGSLNGGVAGMALSGGSLYIGGIFSNVSNSGTTLPTADYFAIWDGTNWSTLGDTNGVFNFSVEAMAILGSDVYVGGNFANLGGDARIDYIARWDGSAWNPVGNLTQTYGSISSSVEALAVDGTDLYVGGTFTVVYNEGSVVSGATRVTKWDGTNWSALGNGVNNTVYALAVDASHNVYVGGAFTNVDFPEADYIVKWNGSAWSALAGNGSGDGALNGAVYALAVKGTDVYAGGSFTSVVNTSNIAIPNTAYLAKWNGSAWSAMDGISSPVGNQVYALTVSGNDVYVGGFFNDLDGVLTADYIAKWDGSVWSGLGSNGSGDGSLGSYVNDIAVNGNRVFVGGAFTNVQNVDTTTLGSADYIAMWSGTNWSALGSDGSSNGSLNNTVKSLRILDNDLWVGGNFQNVNNNGNVVKEADRLAVFGMDIAPTILSITRAELNPTAAAALDFTVTFSESVTGVDASDFAITKTGSVSGATVSGVSGSGATRTVTVNTGSGNGTIRLDLKASGTGIVDAVGLAINGGFTSGQVYTINKILTFKSDGANDGWVLESTETSNKGGTMNNSATTFRLGDEAGNKQYRAILSFDTSSLPDNTVITKVTLKIKKQGLVGADPFASLGLLRVDIRKPFFGSADGLALTDFQSAASKNNIGSFSNMPVNNWYTKVWATDTFFSHINLTGSTQFRLRFQTDDDDNGAADYLKFFSGNAATAVHPTLIIEYYVP